MDGSGTTRVTVEEAARLLGIEKQSVKKRIQRGKLRSEKDARGTTWVHLDGSETVRDGSGIGPETVRDELLDSKDETIFILRDQLREEREARRRADTVIAQLTQATSNLADRLRGLEAPAPSPASPERSEEPPQEPAGEAPGPAPRPGAAEAPAASEDGSARRMAEGAAGSLIANAIHAIASGSWPIISSVLVALLSLVAAYFTALSGLAVLSAVLSAVGVVAALLAIFFLLRLSGAVRRKLEEAEDTVAEAVDEEQMEQESRERERRHREAVARGDEIPY